MKQEMNYGNDHRFIPMTSDRTKTGEEVAPGLFYYTLQVVNLCMVENPDPGDGWVLIDAGMPKRADDIISAAEKRFGAKSRPRAIILTHGHFDHTGSVIELVKDWEIPVYAHERELPYLTGEKKYPKPDPTVEGGLVAKMSWMFPREAIDLGENVKSLPEDGSVPELKGWRWIHTPGHTPGHVSLLRDEDRALIAGDAFITVRQDSLLKVLTQKQEVSGPPRYFTTDWEEARKSVQKLAALKPRVAVTGHGLPMKGEALADGLNQLVREFDRLAVPDHGKYLH